MNAPQNMDWEEQIERLHRGKLTSEQRDALRDRARLQGKSEWLEAELGLERGLEALERPVVSSNFTSLVLQAVERDSERAKRRNPSLLQRLLGGGLWPRWVGASTALAAVALTLFLQGRAVDRQRRAENLVQVVRAAEASQAAKLPPVETLQDFEAIQISAPRAQVDYVGLVAALSE